MGFFITSVLTPVLFIHAEAHHAPSRPVRRICGTPGVLMCFRGTSRMHTASNHMLCVCAAGWSQTARPSSCRLPSAHLWSGCCRWTLIQLLALARRLPGPGPRWGQWSAAYETLFPSSSMSYLNVSCSGALLKGAHPLALVRACCVSDSDAIGYRGSCSQVIRHVRMRHAGLYVEDMYPSFNSA